MNMNKDLVIHCTYKPKKVFSKKELKNQFTILVNIFKFEGLFDELLVQKLALKVGGMAES